ncbi:uncharacterized protein BDV14DRAFT_202271 [Aspergillus stella-maris]|uniref:uncharacterized protein n=1 Tax=Aspergillus stella-maris TaxID=1810926 RepID=UPI003CCD5C69
MYSVHSRKNGTIKRLVFECPHCDGEDPIGCIANRHYIMCERCGKDYSPELHEKCNWCKDWPASCDHEASMKWLEDNWGIAGGKPTERNGDVADAASRPSASAGEDAGEDVTDFVSKDDGEGEEPLNA